MILITGAAGKTGRAVLRALSQPGQDIRAFVHRSEQGEIVRSLGATEVIVGNLMDDSAVLQAMDGVQAIYHIPPNVHPEEVAIGERLISAAKATGVEPFVYHSVLYPAIEAMPHHWQKMRVEELLINSGLGFAILQPTAYMQNLFGQWESFIEQGRYAVPYPVETRLCLVDLEDLAEVARMVLMNLDHSGATYQIVGTEPMSQVEIAEIVSAVLNRSVKAITIPVEEWEEGAQKAGLGKYQILTLRKMFEYYEGHGLVGNPGVLGWLLGRNPTTLSEAIEQEHKRRQGETTH